MQIKNRAYKSKFVIWDQEVEPLLLEQKNPLVNWFAQSWMCLRWIFSRFDRPGQTSRVGTHDGVATGRPGQWNG